MTLFNVVHPMDHRGAWYWKNHPFKAEPLSANDGDRKFGYTHRVAGRGGLGALCRSEADAHRLAELWNDNAAIYCMTEMP